MKVFQPGLPGRRSRARHRRVARHRPCDRRAARAGRRDRRSERQRPQPGADGVRPRLAEIGARGRGAVFDVVDAAGRRGLVDSVVKEYGKLSILVNNAGITRDTLAMRMKDDDWAAVLETNLSGVFRMSRAVLRGMMKAKHGRIINITSVVGATGNAGQANYAAAKAGVVGMTQGARRARWAAAASRSTASRPGFIDTDMTRALNEAQTQALLGQIPLGRLGQADDSRVGGRVPCVRRRVLRFRRHAACQRWHVHELKRAPPSARVLC